jgi:hypothetical protein
MMTRKRVEHESTMKHARCVGLPNSTKPSAKLVSISGFDVAICFVHFPPVCIYGNRYTAPILAKIRAYTSFSFPMTSRDIRLEFFLHFSIIRCRTGPYIGICESAFLSINHSIIRERQMRRKSNGLLGRGSIGNRNKTRV